MEGIRPGIENLDSFISSQSRWGKARVIMSGGSEGYGWNHLHTNINWEVNDDLYKTAASWSSNFYETGHNSIFSWQPKGTFLLLLELSVPISRGKPRRAGILRK